MCGYYGYSNIMIGSGKHTQWYTWRSNLILVIDKIVLLIMCLTSPQRLADGWKSSCLNIFWFLTSIFALAYFCDM